MDERPSLDAQMDSTTFRSYYYLKEELVAFCRCNALPTAGGKIELSDRIAHYLDTGTILPAKAAPRKGQTKNRLAAPIALDTPIEPDFVCSEKHRAFFREKIGERFSFTVAFQKWLKCNAGKTYAQAIDAYHQILEEKRRGNTVIDRQFEYNTYIRDFFADNPGRSLNEAIQCWKRKKARAGHNCYEKTDLTALDD